MSGSTTADHRTPHFTLRVSSGPSIEFTHSEDESRHHNEGRERLRPLLERVGDELEAALRGVDGKTRALVEAQREGSEPPAIEWSALQSEIDRELAQNAYSPYALHVLQRARAKARPPTDHTWDNVMASSFTLILRHETALGSLSVCVRVAGRTPRAALETIARTVQTAVHPATRALRIPLGGTRAPSASGEAVESDEGGVFTVRTHRVVVRLARPGDAAGVAGRRDLSRRLARRLDREIASVQDGVDGEFDRPFEVALKKAAFRLEQTPIGGGFTSPFLAEVPAEVEIDVQLRTVESDEGRSLDRALLERMLELGRAEVPTLKRHDSANAINEIGPRDWVLVRRR